MDSYAAYSMSANGANDHFRNILEPRGLGLHNVRSFSSRDIKNFAFIDPPRQIFVFFDNDKGVDVLLDMDPTSSTDGPGPVVCIRYKDLPNTAILNPPLFFFGESGSVGIAYADAIDGRYASLRMGQEALGWDKKDLLLHIVV
ncbi:hypothetical protein HETIRDRAFT_412283, partial [Heterobasidion irregulare TC 32-1]